MNIIRMTGGLGNQMFQYALGMKYLNMGIDVKFEDFTEYEGRDNARPICLDAFGIDYPKCTRDEFMEFTDSYPGLLNKIRRHTFGRKSREYHESSAEFDSKLLMQDNSYITGYFQSEKYFEDIKDEVLERFTFKESIVGEALGLLKDDEEALALTASVHIRRGDYLELEEQYGGICTEEYYAKAIGLLSDVRKFLVFSNDSEWAKAWSKKYVDRGITMKIIEGTDESTGYLDMCLMSMCGHNIIANSSFSWWGAYLNKNPNKKVIAPKCWINSAERKDIYTQDMIRL